MDLKCCDCRKGDWMSCAEFIWKASACSERSDRNKGSTFLLLSFSQAEMKWKIMVRHWIILQIQSCSPLKTLYNPGARLVLSRAIAFTIPCIPVEENCFAIPLSCSFSLSPLWLPVNNTKGIGWSECLFSFLICFIWHICTFGMMDASCLFQSSLFVICPPSFFQSSAFLTAFRSFFFFCLHSALMARQSSGVQKGNISWKLERIHPCCFRMNWNLVPSAVLISSPFWHSLFFCFLSLFFLRPPQPSSHLLQKHQFVPRTT